MKIFRKRAALIEQEQENIKALAKESLKAIQEATEVSSETQSIALAFIEEREKNHFRERLLNVLTGEHAQ